MGKGVFCGLKMFAGRRVPNMKMSRGPLREERHSIKETISSGLFTAMQKGNDGAQTTFSFKQTPPHRFCSNTTFGTYDLVPRKADVTLLKIPKFDVGSFPKITFFFGLSRTRNRLGMIRGLRGGHIPKERGRREKRVFTIFIFF